MLRCCGRPLSLRGLPVYLSFKIGEQGILCVLSHFAESYASGRVIERRNAGGLDDPGRGSLGQLIDLLGQLFTTRSKGRVGSLIWKDGRAFAQLLLHLLLETFQKRIVGMLD